MSAPADLEPFCCRCQSDYPIAPRGSGTRMGYLFPLARLPKRFQRQFASWRDHGEGAYLCGSCLFDLTDDD